MIVLKAMSHIASIIIINKYTKLYSPRLPVGDAKWLPNSGGPPPMQC